MILVISKSHKTITFCKTANKIPARIVQMKRNNSNNDGNDNGNDNDKRQKLQCQ